MRPLIQSVFGIGAVLLCRVLNAIEDRYWTPRPGDVLAGGDDCEMEWP